MIDLARVTACLNTKDPVYPKAVLEHTASFPFGEILVLTGSDSPYRKHELFAKAKYDWLYYSDDDAICPIQALAEATDPNSREITLAMKAGHFEAYRHRKQAMGIGWGAFFHRDCLKHLKRYTDVYGEDELFKRDTEKIWTALCPHKRLVLPIYDLPSAEASDRLWRQPNHYPWGDIVEQRCASLSARV